MVQFNITWIAGYWYLRHLLAESTPLAANSFLVVQRRGIPWRTRPMEWLFLYSRQFCNRLVRAGDVANGFLRSFRDGVYRRSRPME